MTATFFAPLVGRWPDVPTFAREVGCPRNNVHEWVRVDSIPAQWFAAVIRAAEARGFHDITAELLADRAEDRRLAKEAERAAGQQDAAA